MPTIPSALAMESLLQYTTKEPLAKKLSSSETREMGSELRSSAVAIEPSPYRFYSPSLYITPAPGPIPDVSSTLFSPNIYVVNRKRRDGILRPASSSQAEDSIPLLGSMEKEMEEKKVDEWAGNAEIVDGFYDDFLMPRGSINVCTSGSDVEDGDSLQLGRFGHKMSAKARCQDEYYDTADEFFSDGSLSNSSYSVKNNNENELRALKLSLSEESGRRKAAEERLIYLNKQFEKIVNYLSFQRPSSLESSSMNYVGNEIDPSEICQEFVVLKHVAEALDTELALDEARKAFMEIVGTKNHEISRLHDRMRYYEAMNREMSQRNQEAVGLARERRRRRQRMRKWILGCVGLSVTVGASFLAFSNWKDLSSSSSSSSSSDK